MAFIIFANYGFIRKVLDLSHSVTLYWTGEQNTNYKAMKTKPNPFQKAVRSFLRDVIEAGKTPKDKKAPKKSTAKKPAKKATPKAEKPTGKPAGYVSPKAQRNFEKFMATKK